MTRAYEDLRSSHLQGAGSLRGRALVIHRGVAAWMQVWVASSASPRLDTQPGRVDRLAVSRGCEEELIHVLATMALSSFQEAMA